MADVSDAPYFVLEKTRLDNRDVRISVPDLSRWSDHTPVLVDDIVSTAHTMIETTRRLIAAGMRRPVCVAVHGIFAGDAFSALLEAGASRVVTTNTISHATNEIDVTDLLAAGIRQVLSLAE